MKLTKKSNLHDVAVDVIFDEQQLIDDICSRDLPPHPFSDWRKFAANQFILRLRAEFAARYESDVAQQALETLYGEREANQKELENAPKTLEDIIAYLKSIGIIDTPQTEEILFGTELYNYVRENANKSNLIGSSNNQRTWTDYHMLNGKKYAITSLGDGIDIRRAENYNG